MAAQPAPGGFVGRGAELARLEAALERAARDGSAVVVVGGEAGIGKTRLIGEFVAGVRQRGGAVLSGSCPPSGGRGTPYAPFVEALRALVQGREPATLPALLGPGRIELARLLPEIDTRPRADATPPPRDDGLEGDRYAQARLFEAYLGVLHRLGRDGPVVVVIDDIQWSDAGTRTLIEFLLPNARGSDELYVLAVRTDDLEEFEPALEFLAEIQRDSGVERLELGPLEPSETRDLLRELGATTPGEGWEDLVRRSSGNPFFIEQLATGPATSGTAHDRMAPGLREVLAAVLAEIPPRARQVLRAAAAAGRRVDDSILAVVLQAPDTEIADALRLAMARGILVEAEDGGGYAFRHALLREVAYAELLYGERDRLHGAFAAELERRGEVGGVPVTPAELAYHWDAADERDRAVPALVDAGVAAEQVSAFSDARRAFERALDLWPADLATAGRLSADKSEVLHRAADCAVLSGDYSGAVELGRRSIALADARSNPIRVASLQERMRWYLWEAGLWDDAAAAVDEALRLLPEDPPTAARARALGHLAGLRLTTGDPAGALRPATEALEIARAVGGRSEEALALGIIGWVTALGGRVDEGVAAYRQGLAISEELGGVEGIALGLVNLAALLDRVGRAEACLEAATAGAERLRQLGVVRTYGGVLHGLAVKALFDLGRWAEALERADAGLELDPIGPAVALLHVERARVHTNCGRLDEAAGDLAAAGALMATAGRGRSYQLALLSAETELALARGRTADVRDLTVRADALARSDAVQALDPALAWIAWFALRAEADAVTSEIAGPAGEVRDTARRARVEAIATRVEAFDGRNAAADPRVAAVIAICRAERGRFDGTDDASTWADVAKRWSSVPRPHVEAYARFREASAHLAARHPRSEARTALQAAYSIAVSLGAEPLVREIRTLAGLARLELAEAGEPIGVAVEGNDDVARSLGLTARESEVVRLMAFGLSNQEIADRLFLSRKTASVHVSNILGKLGVANRIQAAAVARRLGLVGSPAEDDEFPGLDAFVSASADS